MTKEQKYLKEHFLEPETRCNTYISAATKKHWKILLDILEIVLDICKKNNIKVWMAGGSVLGAVRHKGIIPWDDDIDVMIPREDYKRFCKIAPDLLPKGFFLQTQVTDPFSLDSFAKIRKIGTTAIIPQCAEDHRKSDMSIFLDIFPLDKIPEDQQSLYSKLRIAKLIEKLREYRCEDALMARRLNFSFKRRVAHKIGGWVSFAGSRFLIRICDNLFRSSDRNLGGSYCMCPVWWMKYSRSFNCKRWTYSASLLAETVYLPFEYLEVPIPAGYERLLEITYGEWRKFVRGTSCHSGLIVDTERDYREVLKERFGYTDRDFQKSQIKQ